MTRESFYFICVITSRISPSPITGIGGHVEEGETPEEALVREVKEELDIDLKDYSFYKKYECLTGDAYENIKYIYSGKINLPIRKVTLLEGVRPQYFSREEIPNVKFANILKSIVMEYISDSNENRKWVKRK